MIKRLFYKTKVKLWLIDSMHIDISSPDFEEIFNWIYMAPWWRLWLRYHCFARFYRANKSGPFRKDPLWKDKAEELYKFLCK